MKETVFLEKFEEKYKFLYQEMVNGVPLYTCLRDDVLLLLQRGHKTQAKETKKGKVYIRRLVDGVVKLRKLRKAETLIFTSAVYRRDHGRNLAVEYLMEQYPEAVVFEWPSRNDDFDSAYFSDPQRAFYCPLDTYVVKYKLLSILNRKGLKKKEEQIRAELREKFSNAPSPDNENEKAAIEMIIDSLPSSYVTTEFSQNIFRKMFRKYRNVKYAIDFWGSGRENIFPVLDGNPERIELQHGIITSFHPGYIYPSFVGKINTDFFNRILLVYGEATKKLLFEDSIFDKERIEVIGNPRIEMFKKAFSMGKERRKLILFASQPLQPVIQDGVEINYYDRMVEFLKEIAKYCKDIAPGYKVAVKLHPRETRSIEEIYRNSISNCEVYNATSQLYDLFNQTLLHVTVASTTLYEAAAFDVPTILFDYGKISAKQRYGFEVLQAQKPNEISGILDRIMSPADFIQYTAYLKEQSSAYM